MRPEVTGYRERNLAFFLVTFGHTLDPRSLNWSRIGADLDDLSVESDKLVVVCAEPAHLV